ncbi:MAG: hypothetical protein L0I76_04020 [Pseudonocardia sp.]|nr:hypothetical protein [Pseudonocardia sp.]
MAPVHMKGFVLQKLLQDGPLWDYDVVDAVEQRFGVSGPYWTGTVRLTLIDLYSAGLLNELDVTVDPTKSDGQEKVLFRYEVNAFGRERMKHSGLLEMIE